MSAVPNAIEACTSRGDATLGRMRRRRIQPVGLPIEIEASTKTSSRTASVCPRMRRAKDGTSTIEMAIMVLVRPGPSTPAIAIAKISGGRLISASMLRMSRLSMRPAK